MPIQRRSGRTQAATLVISIAALAVAVLLGVLVLRAATDDGERAIDLGDDVFEAGNTTSKAEEIAKDGPFLFSDVAGRGQRRPMFLQHLGDDPKVGWFAFEAVAPGAPEGCFLAWDADTEEFIGVDDCVEERFPADGDGLKQFAVTVTEDGELEVDLRESPG